MSNIKREISKILKDAGIKKPTKIVNQIIEVVSSQPVEAAKESIKEIKPEDERKLIHRNRDNYIHKITPSKKSSKNAITSIELIADVDIHGNVKG